MSGGRPWTKEEEEYLAERWGTTPVPSLCEKLDRSEAAIMIRVGKLGLAPFLDSGEYITLNQLVIAVTGNNSSYSYKMKSWVENRGLPVHMKRNNRCTWRVVRIEEFWKWAERNRSFIDFTKFEPLLLGPEPAWVAEQRKLDLKALPLQRKDPWSPAEDSRLQHMLRQCKYGYAELAKMLGRSAGAIQRRICDLGLRERPIKADNHTKWTAEELNALAAALTAGRGYAEIALLLGKSEKAIRGRAFVDYKTENADKIRAALAAGPWGTGAPPKTIWTEKNRPCVKRDIQTLHDLLVGRLNNLAFGDRWQRLMCMHWDDLRGCTADEDDCDTCASFQRIREQFCVRCGGTFIERQPNRLCKRCRDARRQQARRKWAELHGRADDMQDTA